jgi:hypothetical protein
MIWKGSRSDKCDAKVLEKFLPALLPKGLGPGYLLTSPINAGPSAN